ncbi:OFA family MFS transporter [Massilia sp. TSP1-1-2]|uniref:OFA family MFS transporter n=1 Tax=Massilia sp. TSP1-1-2 TaxID=2804649 RepID=UPI003CED27A3
MAFLDILDKEHTIAGPTFNRWLVPPAALAIHLCIGMAYGFSVFWLPLSRALGIKEPLACKDIGLMAELFSSTCDWRISSLTIMYTLFFLFLGSSAALFGGWLERAGPRKAGVVSALCWCGGLVISAIGVYHHQLWMMWLGSGVIGGIGLGLGYISPVSTLIKWFPDKRGMATGMAIMGFGGGAVIGAPMADKLMKHFASDMSVGVWQTFLVMAAVYFVFMMSGALGYRVPASGWKPAGWVPPPAAAKAMIATRHVHVKRVWGIPQFWLLWAVLCLNVTAGIGILGMASPLVQEIFAGRLIGIDVAFNDLSVAQKGQIAAVGAGLVGLLSLFNIGGRFVWASCSDYIGRKRTYMVFLILGAILYASIPSFAHANNLFLFVASLCIILSMYGGGFSTVPAYLSDLFGTQMVGAIHGRLLTAWSVAGVFGPLLVNYIRESQIASGVPKAQAYDVTMYVLTGMIVLGLLCNLLVRPVADKYFMTDAELAAEKKLAHDRDISSVAGAAGAASGVAVNRNLLVTASAWAAVGIPLAIGIWLTLQKAAVFFK